MPCWPNERCWPLCTADVWRPIAAWGRVENGRLTLTGRVLSPDGRSKIEAAEDADLADCY